MSEVLVTAEVRREVVETDGQSLVIETPLIGPRGPSGGGEGGPETDPIASAALATHEADTTSVHGIADTSALVVDSDLGTAAAADTGDFDASGAAAAAQAASQPLDSDLTAIAALSTTSFGRSLLALASAAAGRTALGAMAPADMDTLQGASSPVSTFPDRKILPDDVEVSLNANQFAARAVCRVAGTYTKIRFAVGSAAIGATDFRMGVWNSSSVKLAETANLIGGVAINTGYEKSLVSSVTLAEGDVVFLGGAATGGALTIVGSKIRLAFVGTYAPSINRRTNSYSGGSLADPIGTVSAGELPWAELVP